jgi:CubicO group peptidase (beta-lactamase class C family)
MSASEIPGAAIGIVHGDKIIYTKGFGTADGQGTAVTEDTPFYIGSVGKTFTALAVRQLEAEGKLSTRELVTAYIPWFRLADGKGAQIKVEDLISHTSGLSMIAGNAAYTYNKNYSIEDAVKEINKREKVNRPVGSGYEYSNLNYVILGLIIEYVSGLDYDDYINQHLFTPMQMEDSFVSKEEAVENGLAQGYRALYGRNIRIDYDYPRGQVPAGYQLSSAHDMSKYMLYYLNNGYSMGKSILANNRLLPMEDPEESLGKNASYYSLDWGITTNPALYDYNRFYGFLGATSNFNSAMLISQVHRYGIIVLVNQRGSYRKPELTAQLIGNGITDILLHNKIPAPVKREYDRRQLTLPVLSLMFAAIALYSCLRFPARLSAGKRRLAVGLMVFVNFILPILFLTLVPVLYDNNWRYFLNVGADTSIPLFALCTLLLILGVIKVLLMIRVGMKRRRASGTIDSV